MSHRRYDIDQYDVGIVVEGLLELRAIQAVLDDEHFQQAGSLGESEAYTFGSIGEHNVVIAQHIPSWHETEITGTNTSIFKLYHSMQLRLYIGLAGAVADPDRGQDIRLGDVVVDLGIYGPNKTRFSFSHFPDSIRNPSTVQHAQRARTQSVVRAGTTKDIIWTKPDADFLFQSSSAHLGTDSCRSCDLSQLVIRTARTTEDPVVHYGLISSAPSNSFDAEARDQMAKKLLKVTGVPCFCFGTGVAAIGNIMPCVIVSGICHYSDSHRGNEWRPFAAQNAANFVKDFISNIPSTQTANKAPVRLFEKARALSIHGNPTRNSFSNDSLGGWSIHAQRAVAQAELLELGYDVQDVSILLEDTFARPLWTVCAGTNRTTLPAGNLQLPHHCRLCAHYWAASSDPGRKCVPITSAALDTSQSPYTSSSEKALIQQTFEEYCGLAGLFPSFPDRITQLGEGVLGGLRSEILAVGHLDPYSKVDAHFVMRNVHETLAGLLSLCGWTQEKAICCDSFTMIALSANRSIVELKRVDFSLIKDLKHSVEGHMEDMRSHAQMESLIDSFFLLILNLPPDSFRNMPFFSSTREITIHKLYLMTQILCFGLLSYSHAHAGPLQPILANNPICVMRMLGFGVAPGLGTVTASLANLSCLGNMIRHPVMVFHSSSCNLDSTMAYDLSTTPEDLIDTWGPGYFVLSPNMNIIAIAIGGGVIRQPQGSENFHWFQRIDSSDSLSATTFSNKTKIRIGMTTVCAAACPFDEMKSFRKSNGHLSYLGTSSSRWESAQRQFGLQGGQYGVLQFNNTWVKRDEITVKAHYLDTVGDKISLPFLNSLWGLQVSLCTGVARRVTLLDLLADVMDIYVKACLGFSANDWDELLNKYGIVQQFRHRSKLSPWFGSLPPHLQKLTIEVIHYVLENLRPTGIDQSGENLVVAWVSVQDPFHCIRVSCAGQNAWTRMLADSEDCATFAYTTATCLQTSQHHCRQTAVLEWQRTISSVQTHVCRQLFGNSQPQPPAAGAWRLSDSSTYLIGKPETRLKAKLRQPTGLRSETWLNISQTSLPPSLLRNLLKMQRIRERQSEDAEGEEVVIAAVDD